MSRYRAVLILALLFAGGCTGRQKPVRTFDAPGDVLSAAFSGDGRVLAAVSPDGVLRAWEVSSAKLLDARTVGPPIGRRAVPRPPVAVSPDGSRVACGSGDGRVLHWTLGTPGDVVVVVELSPHAPRAVTLLAFTPDGRELVSLSGGYALSSAGGNGLQPKAGREPLRVTVSDVATGTTVAGFANDAAGAIYLTLSSDASRLATVGIPGMGHTFDDPGRLASLTPALVVLDVRTGAQQLRVDAPLLPGSVDFSPNSRLVHATLDEWRTHTVWDASTGGKLHSVPRPPSAGGRGVFDRAFFTGDARSIVGMREVRRPNRNPAAYLIPSGYDPRDVRIVATDLKRGTVEMGAPLHLREGWGSVNIAAVAPDRRHFVDYRLRMWCVPAGISPAPG